MIHIIIREERRKPPRQRALPMNADIRTPTGKTDARGMPEFTVTVQPPQLHMNGKRGWQVVRNDGSIQTFDNEAAAYAVKENAELYDGLGTAHVEPAPFSDNVLYAAEWDQKSPWITILVEADVWLSNRYFGWPEVTEAQWREANPERSLP